MADMVNTMTHASSASRLFAASFAIAVVVTGVAISPPVHAQSWTFPAAQTAGGNAWTAERGTLTPGDAESRLQPDANRHVVLLSPPGLPEAARNAEKFLVQVVGTGLQRVRIQARRDARGGWITIADASGSALRSTAAGYVITRKSGPRDQSIERLRIELEFRTTNPRGLKRIAIVPPKG